MKLDLSGKWQLWLEEENKAYDEDRGKPDSEPVVQVAGFHLITDCPAKEDDVAYWNQNRKSRTKEIED